MATNKLGTLVYDLIADTKGFQQGVVSSRKEVTALKKVFLDSRTPVEAFGIQMQGMQKLIESGARPVNMFSRSIADLAVQTKGGGREARAFVESLRQQASQIVESVGHYRVLSKEDRERVDRLRAVARAIEREVDMQRNAIAEKLKAARQSAEADKQAKQQAIEAKKESDRRAEALKRESQALAEKARHEARVEEIQRRQRQTARQAGARMAEQQQASNLALVRRELEKTITPQQKLVTLASTARAEYAKGNITQQELVSIQQRVVAGLREINPELARERDRIAAVNSQLQERIKREREIANLLQRRRQQAKEEGRRASQQVEAERLNRVRAELNAMITPQQKLVTLASTARAEYAKGNITQQELVAIQRRVVEGLREINPELIKEKENASRLNAQLVERAKHEERIAAILANRRRQFADQARTKSQQQEAQQLAMVRSELEKTVSPQQKLTALASAARAEYAKGNITQQELASIQTRVVAGLREINPELIKERDEREKLASATKRQADSQAALLSRQKQEAQAIRDRLDPRRALAREMTGVRALGAAGMLSPEEVAAEQKRILQSMRELNPVYQEQQRRLAGVRAGLQSLITPMQKNRQATRDLITEFKAGNVGSKQFDARLKQLREEHKKLYEEQKKGNVQQNAFVKGMALQTTALLRQISAISAMYAAIRQIRGGIADALEIGRSQRQFQTFTGSAEVAAGLMNEIRGLAAETPITLGAAQQGVTTLLQYGVSQSEVMGTLRQLGDVSGGSTEALQRLSLAFGQITANTRLQGQELRQLVEAGFNPLMFISEKTGESMFDLRQRMADGDISIDEVRDSLKEATSGAGRFANALENIATETAFGKIERLKSELLRLRADLAVPAAEYIGDFAGDIVNRLGQMREEIRQRVIADPASEISPTELIPGLSIEMQDLNPLTRMAANAKFRIAENMIEAIRASIKMAQSEVDRELPKLLDSLYRPIAVEEQKAVQELNDSIHERIALLKKQRAEVLLGKDEAEIAALVQQGASREYIDALRKEMQLLEDAKNKQSELEEAEKQRHEAAMKRQRDREQAAEKEQRDRAKQIEDDRRAAESLAKSIRTPLEVLEAEMTDIQKAAQFLSVNQRVKLMEQARERFDKAMQEDTKDQTSAAAATRGSVEEFRLLSEINKQQVDREQKNHNEAMGARDQTNRLLNLNISGLNILPVKLGAALSELMGTPVRASGVPTFTFLPPSSFDRR